METNGRVIGGNCQLNGRLRDRQLPEVDQLQDFSIFGLESGQEGLKALADGVG